MSFRAQIFLLLLVWIFSAGALAQEEGGFPLLERTQKQRDRSRSELDRQIALLKKQGWMGQGTAVERRLQKLLKRAQEMMAAKNYERAALFYYGAFENPEFVKLQDRHNVERALIEALLLAQEHYVALDYAYQVILRGPNDPNFTGAYQAIVDILNQLEEYHALEPVLADLKFRYPALPSMVMEEANYLRGREAFFRQRWKEAMAAFGGATPHERLYLKARYHLGVIAVEVGDLVVAEKIFAQIHFLISGVSPLQAEGRREARKKENQPRDEKSLSPEEQMLRDLSALNWMRIVAMLRREAAIPAVRATSPLAQRARYEESWALFRAGRYAEAHARIEGFLQATPEDPLTAEANLLLAHTQLELGGLEVADHSFGRIIDRYQPLLQEIRQRKAWSGREVEERVAALQSGFPEIYAWIYSGNPLQEVRATLDEIEKRQKALQESKDSFLYMQSALTKEDTKVFFAGQSRIKPFGGRAQPSQYQTKQGQQMEELERMQKEIEKRLTKAKEAAEDFELQKGRSLALRNTLAGEIAKLEAMKDRVNRLRTSVGKNEPVKTQEPEVKVESAFSGVHEFDELLQGEVLLVPEMLALLEEKEKRLNQVMRQMLGTRLAEADLFLEGIVRKAYLGGIEVSFLRRERDPLQGAAGVRDELMNRIQGFVGKFPKAPEIPRQLFRLAELYYEGEKERIFSEQERFDVAYEAFLRKEVKEKPLEPKANFTASIELCERVLREYPKFKDRDQVLYVLGYYLEEMNRKRESNAMFERLVREFPQSPFATEAYMRTAENEFAEGAYGKAIGSYERLLKFPESIFYELALYKIAWCHFKLGHYKKSTQHFVELITYSDRKLLDLRGAKDTDAEKRLTDLREEAITYLALSFSEEGGATEIAGRFKELGIDRYTPVVLRRLSQLYFDQSRYGETIITSQLVIAEEPLAPDAPDFQSRIITCYEKQGDFAKAFEERSRLVSLFGPRSAWVKANQNRKDVLQRVERLTEENLLYTATFYHEKAQTQTQQTQLTRTEYAQAIEAYRKFLWEFPDSPEAYEIRFFYAEALFEAKEFELAAFHYVKVSQAKGKDQKYKKDAALNAILAYENLMRQKGIQFEEKARQMLNVKIPALPEPGKSPLVKKRALLPEEKFLLSAYTNYQRLFPLDAKTPEILFKSAVLIYQSGDVLAAQRAFQDFAKRFPQHPLHPSAVNYILNGYITLQDWPEVERMVKMILGDSKLAKEFSRKDLNRLLAVAQLDKAKRYERQGDLAKASEALLAVDQTLQDPDLGAAAIYQASSHYEKMGNRLEALHALEQLGERYPEATVTPKAIFQVAKAYEKYGEYSRAADNFEKLALRYPQSEYGRDALFNAGIFREALGDHAKAYAYFLRYATLYPTQKDAENVHYEAARSAERAKLPAEALRVYKDHVRLYPEALDRRIECHSRAGMLEKALGQGERAREEFGRALATYRQGMAKVGDSGRRYAAQARFEEGLFAFSRFEAANLSGSPKKLAASLEEKAKRLDQANAIFFDVVKIGDPTWAIASLFYVGRSYQRFSEALFRVPVPKNLSAAERSAYQQSLEEQAVPLEEKAIEAYEGALRKAHELSVLGQWPQRIYAELNRMKPSGYPARVESFPKESRQGFAVTPQYVGYPQ